MNFKFSLKIGLQVFLIGFLLSTQLSLVEAKDRLTLDDLIRPAVEDEDTTTTTPLNDGETTPSGISGNSDQETKAPVVLVPEFVAHGSGDPANFVVRVIQIILFLAGIVAVVMIILSGGLMISSAGKDEGMEKGRKTLLWAVVGLLAVIFAYVIVQNVVKYLAPEMFNDTDQINKPTVEEPVNNQGTPTTGSI